MYVGLFSTGCFDGIRYSCVEVNFKQKSEDYNMEVEKIMGNTDKYEKCSAQRKRTKRVIGHLLEYFKVLQI